MNHSETRSDAHAPSSTLVPLSIPRGPPAHDDNARVAPPSRHWTAELAKPIAYAVCVAAVAVLGASAVYAYPAPVRLTAVAAAVPHFTVPLEPAPAATRAVAQPIVLDVVTILVPQLPASAPATTTKSMSTPQPTAVPPSAPQPAVTSSNPFDSAPAPARTSPASPDTSQDAGDSSLANSLKANVSSAGHHLRASAD